MADMEETQRKQRSKSLSPCYKKVRNADLAASIISHKSQAGHLFGISNITHTDKANHSYRYTYNYPNSWKQETVGKVGYFSQRNIACFLFSFYLNLFKF